MSQVEEREAGGWRVPLRGAYNFRDLGGYRTAGGRRVRTGLVFRSDTLSELTDADVATVRDQLGLRTVIDLRAPQEAEREGRGPLAAAGGGYHYYNLPFRPDRALADEGVIERKTRGMAEHYLHYFDEGAGPAAAASLRLLAEPANLPAVFHCAAGKDRTGVLAALLLRLLDVPVDVVAADYAATTVALPDIAARLRSRPLYARDLDKLPPGALSAEPGTMRAFLAGVEKRYGGARAWARAVGLQDDVVDQLAATLLAPGAGAG